MELLLSTDETNEALLKTKYPCEICSNAVFNNKTLLSSHMHVYHKKDGEYACHKCPYKCIKRTNLTRHYKAIHRQALTSTDKTDEAILKVEHSCKICPNAVFGFRNLLSSHIQAYHKIDDKYACHKCNYKCKQFSHLHRHITIYHSQPSTSTGLTSYASAKYRCEICDASYKLKASLLLHRQNDHTKYACDKCKYKNKDFLCIIKHVKEDHSQPSTSSDATGDASAKYPCKICNNDGYESGSDLLSHIAQLHTVYACNKCEYANKKFCTLTKHVRVDHPQLSRSSGATGDASASAKYPCKICGKRCETNTILTLHYRNCHKTNNKFACNKCEFTSINKSDVLNHARNLHSKTSIHCVVCGNIFSTKYEYKMHQIRHRDPSEPDKFRCSLCIQKYVYFSKLEAHYNTKHFSSS